MKLSHFAIAAVFASVVAAQNTTTPGTSKCPTCIQTALQNAPGCKGQNITLDNPDPNANPAIAKCFCANLDGSFLDVCKSESACGAADLDSFKGTFKDSLTQVGLQCNGPSPTFIPPPPDPVAPNTDDGTKPAGSDGPGNPATQVIASMAVGLVATVAGLAIQLL